MKAVTAIAMLLLTATERLSAEVDQKPPSPIDSQQRASIDGLALRRPIDRQPRVGLMSVLDQDVGVKLYGDVVSRWVSLTPLPADFERRHAAAAHSAIVNSSRIVETPLEARRVLERLTGALPERMRRRPLEYSLTVVDAEEKSPWTVGDGYLYITLPMLQELAVSHKGGDDRLAYVLAREIGHCCRRHCRSRYRLLWMQQELQNQLRSHVFQRAPTRLTGRLITTEGDRVTHHYTRREQDVADLFALHLCRKAGFDLENCLDVLRTGALAEEPHILDGQGAPRRLEAVGEMSARSSLSRLGLARRELDGIVEGEEYGLFVWDDGTETLLPAEAATVQEGERAVVFVHGMESGASRYIPLMRLVAQTDALANVRVLAFQYPNDGSLAQSARFLANEMKRVCTTADVVDFVCHSAGGLVVRFYVEVLEGRYRRVVFHGTPHDGSDLARLRGVLEAKQLLGDLDLGIPTALENMLRDGRGQVRFDLQPDSLFLAYLNHPQREGARDRYFILRGRALRRANGWALKTAVAAGRMVALDQMEKRRPGGPWGDLATESIRRVNLPDEIARGDLAVSLESAALQGAASVETYPLNHLQLTHHPDVMTRTVEILCR